MNKSRTDSPKAASTNIGLWGPRSAGKTTFIALLYHARGDSGWTMKAADDESDDFRLDAHEAIFERRVFPPATDPSHVRFYSYDFSRKAIFGKDQAFRLVLPDASGEWFERPSEMLNQFPDVETSPYHWLARCRGLILLLNPIEVSQKQDYYFRVISRALGMLRRNESQGKVANMPLSAYVAVCFTQMDRTPPLRKQINSEGEQVTRLAEQILGDKTFRDIQEACNSERVEFFGCSALGWLRNAKGDEDPINTIEEANGQVRIKDPQQIRPVNIFKPIEWLLEQLSPGMFGF